MRIAPLSTPLKSIHSPNARGHISLREKLILATLCAEISILAFGLGGIFLKPFICFSSIAVIAFILLFVPLKACALSPLPSKNLRRLIHFPVFWLGLSFLSYILIQALNPSWTYKTDGAFWWMESIPYIPWLPSSMQTPFEPLNPFRVLIVMASGVMLICSLEIGLTKRRSIIKLLGYASINSLFVALLSMMLQSIKPGKLFGILPTQNISYLGPFTYRNQGAAYLYFLMALTLGFFLHYLVRSWQKNMPSSPYFLFLSIASLLMLVILNSFSRGGILCAGFISIVFILVYIGVAFRARNIAKRNLVGFAVMGGLLIISASFTLSAVQIDKIAKRFEVIHEEVLPLSKRSVLAEATYIMFLDNWLYGWGAGSFRYYFPVYRERYPILAYENPEKKVGKCHIRDAHMDWFQFLAEYGVIGCSFLFLIAIFFISKIIHFWRGLSSITMMIYSGTIALFIHATFDFIFQSPSLLLSFVIIFTAAVKFQIFTAHKRSIRSN